MGKRGQSEHEKGMNDSDRKYAKHMPNCLNVFVSVNCYLKGPGEYIIKAHVDDNEDNNFDFSDYIFVPEKIKLLKKGLLTATELVKIDKGYIPIRVYIPDEMALCIYKGTKSG